MKEIHPPICGVALCAVTALVWLTASAGSLADSAIRNIHTTYSGDPRHEATVSWRTAEPLDPSRAMFATPDGKWQTRNGISIASANGYNHHVKLDNLIPGTEYVYRVSGTNDTSGPVCRFRTAPSDEAKFSFAVIGDVQGKDQPSEVWGKAGEFLAAQKDIAFTVLMGDLVDLGGDQGQWDAFFNPPTEKSRQSLFHAMAVMPLPGNHDYYALTPEGQRNNEGIRLFLDQFRLPANDKFDEWNGRFYALEYGAANLVMLDTEGAPETRDRMLAEETQWLGGLNFESKPWNLAFMHQPVYPFLRHTPSFVGRSIWRPNFFDRYFSVVFNGHNHAHAVSKNLRADDLDGLSGGRGFTDPWKAERVESREGTLPRTLLLEENDEVDYVGSGSSGRALSTATQGSFDTSPIRMNRAISPLDTRERKELWLGFLYKKKGGWYASGQGGLRLSSNGNPNGFLQVDTTRTEDGNSTSGRFRVSLGDAVAVSSKRIAIEGRENIPDKPFFVLAKFEFGVGKTIGYLKQYQSPEPLPSLAPETWDAIVEVPDKMGAIFDTLSILGESPRRESLVDELRIGGSVASIVPPSRKIQTLEKPWIEACFDVTGASTPDDGVIYYDAGGINHSTAPADFWYIRHRQEDGMKLLCIVEVDTGHLHVKTVFFDDFGDRKAGDVLHEFTRSLKTPKMMPSPPPPS